VIPVLILRDLCDSELDLDDFEFSWHDVIDVDMRGLYFNHFLILDCFFLLFRWCRIGFHCFGWFQICVFCDSDDSCLTLMIFVISDLRINCLIDFGSDIDDFDDFILDFQWFCWFRVFSCFWFLGLF